MTLVLSLLMGALAGAVTGGLLAWSVLRHCRQPSRPVQVPPILDPEVLEDLDRAAKAWAASHDQPETVANLVADKLRLVWEMTARRERGR